MISPATQLLLAGWLTVTGAATWVEQYIETEPQRLEVTVTAYNSVPDQTVNDPKVTASGHTLEDNDFSIAVSRDLFKMGLTYGTEVKISGLPGTWVVRDKMHWRWKKRIDIHLGENQGDAREFGKQTHTIYWEKPVTPKITGAASSRDQPAGLSCATLFVGTHIYHQADGESRRCHCQKSFETALNSGFL